MTASARPSVLPFVIVFGGLTIGLIAAQQPSTP